MQIIQREKAAHWYKWSSEFNIAESCHEVPRAKGDGFRRTTLADARKMNLLPSVTSILSVLNKPGLETWKQEQAILAALTLPRLPDEPLEVFAKRVTVDMDAQSEAARAKGIAIHDGVADLLRGQPLTSLPPELSTLLEPIQKWIETNLIACLRIEEIVACPKMGVAGRLDLFAELIGLGPAIVDFKTQTIKNGQPVFYDEWGLQLAAYRRLADGPDSDAALLSVIIDANTGAVFQQQWPVVLLGIFEKLLAIWQWQKGYIPNPEAELRRSEPALEREEA